MSNLDAIAIVENVGPDTDEDTYLTAWQRLIDSGLAWTKSYWHREAINLIASGRCTDTWNMIGGSPHAHA